MSDNRIRLAGVVTVVLLLSGVSQALEILVWEPVNSEHRQKQQLKQYKGFIANTIARIDQACHLTAAQEQKLLVASKGAVDRAMSKWAQANRTPHTIRQLGNVQQFESTARRPTPAHPVLRESVWQKTFAKVLTAEQKTKYQTFEDGEPVRQASQRAANIIWQLNRQIPQFPP